jgi:predicted dehydrogenase
MANFKAVLVKTGLCAYGMSGRVFHAPFLSCMDEFELSAVTERHARKAVKRYPGIKTYSSVEDMLGDDSLELVVVNTPNVTHYKYAKKALQEGKHVIVEKPFAATAEQAEELIRTANEVDKQLVVFQNRRWDSDFQVVQQVVTSQRLGKLIEAEFHYDRYRLELSAKDHKERPDTGVGLIYDLGPHLIDQAIVLFGKPKHVFAQVQYHRPGSEVDDYFMIQLLYGNFTCTLKASLLVREPIPAYVLHGTKGSFRKTRADVQEADLKEGEVPCSLGWGKEPDSENGLLHTRENGQEVNRYISAPLGCYQKFYHKVYQCLRHDAPSPVPLQDSLLNMRIIEAALESQKKTIVVELNE